MNPSIDNMVKHSHPVELKIEPSIALLGVFKNRKVQKHKQPIKIGSVRMQASQKNEYRQLLDANKQKEYCVLWVRKF